MLPRDANECGAPELTFAAVTAKPCYMDTRNDHYVPQFLLKYFLRPSTDTFWQVAVPTGQVSRRSPAQVCRDDGHDAVYSADSQVHVAGSAAFARFVKEVEDQVAPALARLHATAPSETDLDACLFLAGRLLASAPYRRAAKAITNQQHGLPPKTSPTEEIELTRQFAQILLARTGWSVLVARGEDGEEFLSSDAPLAPMPLHADERIRSVIHGGAMLGPTWTMEDVPIVFPVGRRLALVLDGAGSSFRTATALEIAEVNSGVANFALARAAWLLDRGLLPFAERPFDGDLAPIPVMLAPAGDTLLATDTGTVTVQAWASALAAGWNEHRRLAR